MSQDFVNQTVKKSSIYHDDRVRILARPEPIAQLHVLFGPVVAALVEQAVGPFRQTDRLRNSERAMLMGGAYAKA